jgi:hypothetical protein
MLRGWVRSKARTRCWLFLLKFNAGGPLSFDQTEL